MLAAVKTVSVKEEFRSGAATEIEGLSVDFSAITVLYQRRGEGGVGMKEKK